ncbi:unnamed protein product [Sphagnum tenellum]
MPGLMVVEVLTAPLPRSKGDAGPGDNVPIVLLLQGLLSLNGQLQKLVVRVTEIFGTNNSNNNNNNAFCGNKKIYVTKMLASKMKLPGRGKGKGWRMMGFSLELSSKLLAPIMIRPAALKFIAMEMGSLELVINVISCIFYVVADQDLVVDKQGIEGSQILANEKYSKSRLEVVSRNASS